MRSHIEALIEFILRAAMELCWHASRWQGCLRASPIRDERGYTMSGPIERDLDRR